MSRKTLFEHNEGRQVLKLKEYCEDAPVWRGLARSSLAGVVLYVIILMMIIISNTEAAESFYESVGDIWTIICVAGTMAAFAAAYSLISDTIFRKNYKRLRSTLSRYRSDVLSLGRMEYEQEKLIKNETDSQDKKFN